MRWAAFLVLVACSPKPVDDPWVVEAHETSCGRSTADASDEEHEGDDPDAGGSWGGSGPLLDVADGAPPTVVYGQDADTLYRLDPETFELVEIGPFAGCADSVIDIAVDRAGAITAVTYSALYAVDPATGACVASSRITSTTWTRRSSRPSTCAAMAIDAPAPISLA